MDECKINDGIRKAPLAIYHSNKLIKLRNNNGCQNQWVKGIKNKIFTYKVLPTKCKIIDYKGEKD